MIVYDTCVVSEFVRPRPSPVVAAWGVVQDFDQVAISAVTLAELEYGLAVMPPGARRESLALSISGWIEQLRVPPLPFDAEAARWYATVMLRRRQRGLATQVGDGEIGAICASHGATLATRNVRDFEDMGIDIVDPWLAP